LEPLTLALALIAVLLILRSKPLTGLFIYLALLCWYSAWQPVTILGIHLTGPRMVMPFLLWRCARDPLIKRRFRWMAIDTAVIVLAAAEVAAGFATTSLDQLLQNRAGAFFDTSMVYFTVRLAVMTEAEYVRFFKGLIAIAAPLAFFGVYQAVTGSNPWGVFVNQGQMFEGATVINDWVENSKRLGFYRASVNFPYSITFGFFFALIGAVAAGAWYYVSGRRRRVFVIGLCIMLVGMLSSMSSGPILAGGTAVVVTMGWPFRRYWKLFVGGLVLCLVAIEIGSNRHWYDVLGWYLAFNRATAGYRIALIEETFNGGMTGHWAVGYGLVSPSNIAEIVANWKHTDITNHFVYEVMRFGLVGFIPWAAVMALAIARLRKGFRTAVSLQQQWVAWCIGAGICATLASMMSACWEGQPYNLFWAVLGLAANAPLMARSALPAIDPRLLAARAARMRQGIPVAAYRGGGMPRG